MVSSYQCALFHTHKYGSIHGTCLLLASPHEWEDPVERPIPEVKVKRKVKVKKNLWLRQATKCMGGADV